MSTNFVGKTRLFPSDKSKVPRGGGTSFHAAPLNQQVDIETFCLHSSVFRAICREGSMLAVCLTCLLQLQFCTELFWDVALYFYQRLGCCTIIVLLPLLILIDHRLMRLKWCTELCRVNSRKWKIQYMCTCTVLAVVKSGDFSNTHAEEYTVPVK